MLMKMNEEDEGEEEDRACNLPVSLACGTRRHLFDQLVKTFAFSTFFVIPFDTADHFQVCHVFEVHRCLELDTVQLQRNPHCYPPRRETPVHSLPQNLDGLGDKQFASLVVFPHTLNVQ